MISTQAEAHLQQSREVAKELEKGSSYELTGAKLEKKEQLLREGFVDWTRKDFRSFLNAMERRGRDEVDVIARETSNETGKTEEEVRRYHTVFWAQHKELADWERVIDKIEKGEKRLQRSKEIREALAEKIARCVPAPQLYFKRAPWRDAGGSPPTRRRRRGDTVAAMSPATPSTRHLLHWSMPPQVAETP